MVIGRTRLFRWISTYRAYLRYRRAQPRRKDAFVPVKTLARNTCVSCALYCLGDTFEQRLEGYGERGSNDWSRTARMAAMGAFIGTIDTYWYTLLDSAIPGANGRQVAKKVLLDQIIWSPMCCSTFFFGMSRMEGCSTNEALQEVKQKFWPTYKIDWILWPPAQAINFLFVPPKYRVICVAFITYLWTIFLSYMKHKKLNPVDDAGTE